MKHELGDEVSVILTITQITMRSTGETYYRAVLKGREDWDLGGYLELMSKDIVENKTKTLEAMSDE